jgi:glycolate oxidase FAD binding subunit
VIVSGLSDHEAVRFLSKALNSPHEVSAAAHLPAPAARRSQIAHAFPPDDSVTVLRLEGPHPSVEFRADAVEALFPGSMRLDSAQSIVLWREIGAVQPFLAAANTIVWRVCTSPSAAPALLQTVQSRIAGAEGFYDWGGGLLWIEVSGDTQEDAGAAVIRAALADGHATLLRADAALRSRIPVFQPVAAGLEALSRRVKAGFDPSGILNPGRMQQGI